MIPAEALQQLEQGLQDLQKQNYGAAIANLKEFCERLPNQIHPQFLQAKMGLIRAYRGGGNTVEAISHCQTLLDHPNPEIKQWATNLLSILEPEAWEQDEDEAEFPPSTLPKAGRTGKVPVKVHLTRIADSSLIVFAVSLTLHLLALLAPLFCLTWFLPQFPRWLVMGGIVLGIQLLSYFLAVPWQDYLQQKIYQTRWINLGDLQKYSPEAGEMLLRVCRKQKIALPRLGLIGDRRPFIFSYGLASQQARLVISKGVFRYLDNDEIATLVAHELGHICSKDCTLMTWSSGWGQLFWGLYAFGQRWRSSLSPLWLRVLTLVPLWGCLFLFRLNQVLNRYLSRSREYYADRFAVQYTGNPNGLTRALVKLSKALVKQERLAQTPGLFLEGLRNFGIYDPRTTQACERGNRFSARTISRLLIWDWFNPWSRWVQWRSSHPLLGLRVQVLAHYAEQLDLSTEYALIETRRQTQIEGINPYPDFFKDWFLLLLPVFLGLGLGLAPLLWPNLTLDSGTLIWGGLGLGLGIQAVILWQFPRSLNAPDVLSLLISEETSPFWGTQVQWTGKLRLVKCPDAGRPKLYFHDRTGVIPIIYPYWWRCLPPFTPLAERLGPFLAQTCCVTGYVNRGIVTTLTLRSLSIPTAPPVPLRLYPYLRQGVGVAFCLLVALFLWLT